MTDSLIPPNNRILIVDDNRSIHDDFRKILLPAATPTNLATLEEALFDDPPPAPTPAQSPSYRLDSAFQGQEAIPLAEQARNTGQPYALAFVDIRMPPGWDGVETATRLWEIDPDLQIVICTAYSDYSFQAMSKRLGPAGRFLILKKPFDNIEIQQLAATLTEKWRCQRESRLTLDRLRGMVEQRTAELQQETEGHRRTAEALRVACQQAEAATRAKSVFLANMSHEIRTPLAGIIGMCDLLLETPLDTQQRDYTQTIETCGDGLLNILNDILDFSKIEAGHLRLEQTSFDLPQLVEETIVIPAQQASRKGLELIVNLAPNLPERILGDPHRLRQILLNLLNNAIKFTSQGEIELTAVLDDASGGSAVPQLTLRVRDTGPGIEPAVQSLLFQPFTQADNSTTRRYGGTGLGLAICRRLADLMGGQIGLRSSPGQGSTFWFTIPCQSLPPPPGTVLQPDLSAEACHQRVLVVDDHATNRQYLTHLLRHWGWEPDSAPDGSLALDLLLRAQRQGRPFSLAILDYQMPDEDGLSLARRIGQHLDGEAPAMVLLTSMGDTIPRPLLDELRVHQCLHKPIKQRPLREALDQALAMSTLPKRPKPQTLEPRAAESATEPTTPNDPSQPVHHVLLAEDNPISQRVALQQLRALGWEADLAVNGREAVQRWRDKRYDLVLLDCQMPEMDGLEAARLIRTEEASRGHLPTLLIALTADAFSGTRQRCLEAGMDGFLTKPIKKEQLRAIVLDRAAETGLCLSRSQKS